MSRLTEMEAFAAVVELGGFTDAARRMGVAKSTVSKYVAALEDRLGARLLSRTTRRVSPTEIGLVYFDRAQRILSDAGEADALVAALHGVPSGQLRVGVSSDFGIARISPLIAGFIAAYPEISVDMMLGDEATDLLEAGFDLTLRIGEQKDSSHRARKLTDFTKRMVASPAYLDRNGVPERIEDLSHHRLISRAGLPGGAAWSLDVSEHRARPVTSSSTLYINDGASLLNAARDGLGIAWLPDFLCDDALAAGELVAVLPGLPAQVRPVFAIYPSGRFTPPKVRAFLDYLVAKFAGPSAVTPCDAVPAFCRSSA